MERHDLLATQQRVEEMDEGKAPSGTKSLGFSWVVALLMLFCWVVDFVDRQSLAVLVRFLPSNLRMSNVVYAHLTSLSLLASSLMKPLVGLLLDWYGLRIGLTVSVLAWSAFQMLGGLAGSVTTLGTFRFLLGIPEAANMPALSKVAAEHAAPHARATLIGVGHLGGYLGTSLAFPAVAFLSLHLNWSWAFYGTGLPGFIWVPLWLIFYRAPTRSAAPARAPEAKVSWVSLLLDRRVIGLNLMQVFAGAIWWFHFFWIAPFLYQKLHLDIRGMGMYGWIPHFVAGLGAVAGGYASGYLVRRNWEPLKARKLILWICAAVVPFTSFVVMAHSVTAVLATLAIATFFTSGFSANSFAMPADIFPSQRVASVAGLNAMFNNLAAIAAMQLAGHVVERFSYTPVFVVIAFLLPAGAACAQWLVPSEPETAL